MACVLVTGGAGFLGAAVVRRLAGRGDRVIALDNFQAGVPANLEGLGCNVGVFGGDVTDLGGFLGLIRQHRVQRIIHAAAIVSTLSSLSAPSHVTRVNIEGTLNEWYRRGGRDAGLSRPTHGCRIPSLSPAAGLSAGLAGGHIGGAAVGDPGGIVPADASSSRVNTLT